VFWRIYEPLAYIAYLVGFGFVVGRVFWYFWQWELAAWKWIVAIVVLPLTTIVMPFFIGFAEGDWSMVAAWAAAIMVSLPMLWRRHHGGR
jgi:hypothetical protein